jgi:hypothetical protein
MNWSQFNDTVVRTESADGIELDLRPFGSQQSEALDFWLDEALKQGDPFGKRVTLKTDASGILSQNARAYIAKLREKAIPVFVVTER